MQKEFQTSCDRFIRSMSKNWGIDYERLLSLKYHIDSHIYYYGQHFHSPWEFDRSDEAPIAQRFEHEFEIFSGIANSLTQAPDWQNLAHQRPDSRDVIICNTYFSWAEQIEQRGYQVHKPLWVADHGRNQIEQLIHEMCRMVQGWFKMHFQIMISPLLHAAIDVLLEILTLYYSHLSVKAYLVPYTQPFFEYSLIKIFRQLDKPSFLVVHGHPTVNLGTPDSEYEVDYWVVWGDRMAKKLENLGVKAKEVLVSGHPDYQGQRPSELRFSFEDVLVTTRPYVPGSPVGLCPIYQNRGFNLDWVYRVETTLKKCGVKRARLRPHPSESKEWYWSHVNREFFELDELPLKESFSKATLCLGGHSTVFFESLIHGANYIIFEPTSHNYNPAKIGYVEPGIPFDGSDERIPVADTDETLEQLIREQRKVDIDCLQDYLQLPFRVDSVLEKISMHQPGVLSASL